MQLLVEMTPLGADTFARVLGPDTVIVNDVAAVERNLRESNAAVVVVGPSVHPDAALRMTAKLQVTYPHVGVIIIVRRQEVGFMSAAMKAGARDVLLEAHPAELSEAVARVKTIHATLSAHSGHTAAVPAPAKARIHAIFTAKGGDGKTTVATNVAAALALRPGARVALVDYDLTSANVDVFLHLRPQHTISDAAAMTALDGGALQSLLVHSQSANVWVLPAPVNPEDADDITPQLTTRIMELLQQQFTDIVVDCPPMFSEHVVELVDHAYSVTVVTQPTTPSLKEASIALRTFGKLNFPGPDRHLNLVLNRSGMPEGLPVKAVEETLQIGVNVHLPDDSDVTRSINHGTPLVVSHPQHAFSAGIRLIADRVNPPSESTVVDVTDPNRARKSWFGRSSKKAVAA